MKKPTSLLLFILAFAASASFAQQSSKITPTGIGYLEYLPAGYSASNDKYPVVVSLHGYREKGTSSTEPKRVLQDLSRVALVGLPKYAKAGKKYPFILISPQLKSNHGMWPPSYVKEVIDHVRKTLRIDDRRIYLTGLSLGGFGVWRTAGEYPDLFAAIAPVCPGGNAINKAAAIAGANVAVWAFHGSKDYVVSYRVSTDMVNAINGAPKKPNPLAKVTIFEGMGHSIWDKAYQDTNLLDWMLSFRNGSGSGSHSTAPENSPPVVNAGGDKTIELPAASVEIQGHASDDDGKVEHLSWKKVSGPDATLSNTNAPGLKVTDLREGTYVFRLTARDNDGAEASDDVKVVVEKGENKPPVVNAGSDRSLTLPVDQLTLDGAASDPDGRITAYRWEKISGGTVTLNGVSSATLALGDLKAGAYVFRLTATDDAGAKSFDDVTVTVKENASQNSAPVANAGNDRTITLPTNSVELQGSGTDDDGSISSYLWQKISGGDATWSEASTSILAVTGLSEGVYKFRLTVTDDRGAKAQDEVMITVRRQSQDEPESQYSDAEIIPLDYPGTRRRALNTDAPGLVNAPWFRGN